MFVQQASDTRPLWSFEIQNKHLNYLNTSAMDIQFPLRIRVFGQMLFNALFRHLKIRQSKPWNSAGDKYFMTPVDIECHS